MKVTRNRTKRGIFAIPLLFSNGGGHHNRVGVHKQLRWPGLRSNRVAVDQWWWPSQPRLCLQTNGGGQGCACTYVPTMPPSDRVGVVASVHDPEELCQVQVVHRLRGVPHDDQ